MSKLTRRDPKSRSFEVLPGVSYDDEGFWSTFLGHDFKERVRALGAAGEEGQDLIGIRSELALQLLVERHPEVLPWEDLPDFQRQDDQGKLSTEERKMALVTVLGQFGVCAIVVNVEEGPVITQYELELAPGIKVNKIRGLATEIAMALKSTTVRVVAPLPGKSTVGVEVPKSERGIVRLREVRVQVVCSSAPSVPTDVLLLEKTARGGRFVIVETKLMKNPEIRRKVLGQVVEYASVLCGMESMANLKKQSAAYWAGRGNSLEKAMSEVFGKGWENEVWKPALAAMREGDLRLLIVSDEIPGELKRSILFTGQRLLLSGIEVGVHRDGEIVHMVAEATGTDASPKELQAAAGQLGMEDSQKDLQRAADWLGSLKLSAVALKAVRAGDGAMVSASAVSARRISRPQERVGLAEQEMKVKAVGGGVLHAWESLGKLCRETGGTLDPQQKSVTFKIHGIAGLTWNLKDNGCLEILFEPAYTIGHRHKQAVLDRWRIPLCDLAREFGRSRQPKERVVFEVMARTSPEVVEKLCKTLAEVYGWLKIRQTGDRRGH